MKNRVQALRRHQGITQLKLAENVGASRQNISLIETGKHFPNLKLAIKIARFFNHTVDYVFNIETFTIFDEIYNETIDLVLESPVDHATKYHEYHASKTKKTFGTFLDNILIAWLVIAGCIMIGLGWLIWIKYR